MNTRPRPVWRFLRIAAFGAVPGLVAALAAANPGAVAIVAGVVGAAAETAWRIVYPLDAPAPPTPLERALAAANPVPPGTPAPAPRDRILAPPSRPPDPIPPEGEARPSTRGLDDPSRGPHPIRLDPPPLT
jgi:hypothetical protein